MKSRPSTAAVVQQIEEKVRTKSRMLSAHLGNKNFNVIIHQDEPEQDANLFVTRVAQEAPVEMDNDDNDYAQEQHLIDKYNDCAIRVERGLESTNLQGSIEQIQQLRMYVAVKRKEIKQKAKEYYQCTDSNKNRYVAQRTGSNAISRIKPAKAYGDQIAAKYRSIDQFRGRIDARATRTALPGPIDIKQTKMICSQQTAQAIPQAFVNSAVSQNPPQKMRQFRKPSVQFGSRSANTAGAHLLRPTRNWSIHSDQTKYMKFLMQDPTSTASLPTATKTPVLNQHLTRKPVNQRDPLRFARFAGRVTSQ